MLGQFVGHSVESVRRDGPRDQLEPVPQVVGEDQILRWYVLRKRQRPELRDDSRPDQVLTPTEQYLTDMGRQQIVILRSLGLVGFVHRYGDDRPVHS